MALPVLSGITDALEWYQNNIGDRFAGGALQLLNKGRIGLGYGDEGATAIDQADPRKALDIAFRDAPFQRFLYTSVADPLNLVGVGLPAKLAATGLRGVPLVGRALQAANTVDQLPGRVVGGAIDSGIKNVLKPGFDATYDAALRPMGQGIANRAPGLANAYQTGTRAWREQALLSPGYHVTNAASNLAQSVIHGDMNTAGQTVRGLIRGKNVGDDVAHQIGRSIPQSVKGNTLHASGQPGSADSVFHEMSGSPVYGPTPTGTRLPNANQNPALVQMGNLSNASGRVATHIEDAARKAAWGNATKQAIQRWAKNHADILEGRGLANTAAALRESGGMVQVGSLMPALRADGIRGAAATREIRQMGNAHTDAIREGEQYADKLFFRYGQNNPVDKVGRNMLAFHTYAINNIPSSLRRSAEVPAVMNVPVNWYEESDRYNEQHGLTSKMHGEYQLPFEVGGNEVFVNPAKWLPFGNIIGAATKPEREVGESWLGEIGNTARDVGLGLHPFVDLPMTVTGQYGRAITPGLLRWAQPINAAASAASGTPQDIEGPYKGLVEGIQKEVSGTTPFPYRDYLLRKKQAELGGSANASLATQGPLVREAHQAVGNELGATGLAGFMGVPGLKILSPEERIIRENAHETKNLIGQYGTRAAMLNPTRGIYDNVDPLAVKVENFEKLPPQEQEALLDDPVARDMVIEHLAQKLHGPRYRRSFT